MMDYRSLLFIPGNNPGMLEAACILPADALILDLEDAVAPQEKDAALNLVARAIENLDYGKKAIIVRLNEPQGPLWRQEVRRLAKLPIAAFMPPKITQAEELQMVADYLDEIEREFQLPEGKLQLIALIESATGVVNAKVIAQSSKRLKGILLGAEDFTADLGATRTKDGKEIFYARSQILLAAKSAGILAIDTPFTDATDLEGLEADVQLIKQLGFRAKAAISPQHLALINRLLSPSETEIAYALEVLECLHRAKAQGLGAVALRGKMLDRPIELRAIQVCRLALKLGLIEAEEVSEFSEVSGEEA
ncbi:MAG: CoA ester lyase [Eubacteriales bacterium]|nr:CoA ester lyase [Eubacteriales bacterium]